VTRRRTKNNRLAAIRHCWAFTAAGCPSPTRDHYLRRRKRGDGHPCRAAAPVQPDARPAAPLPANRADLRPQQGLPPRHTDTRSGSRRGCCLTSWRHRRSQAQRGPLGRGCDEAGAVAEFIAAQGSSIRSRLPRPVGRWGSARPGSTSGATGTPRRGGPGASSWRSRSGSCSPPTTASSAHRGSPMTCATPAGGSVRRPSLRSCASRAWSRGPSGGVGTPPARARAGGGRRTQARVRVAAWIDEYNRERKHSSLTSTGGMHSPLGYELALRTARPEAAA
jgi:hypothetical protein